MNPLLLLISGLGVAYFLTVSSALTTSLSKINLDNGLVGYPRIQLKNPNQIAPLIIVLHGRGSDEKGLQNVISKDIPARIIFLRGQIAGETGRYFFMPRLAGPEKDLKTGLEQAGSILKQGIQKLMQIYPTNKVILFGFSQGAALALHLGSIGAVNDVIAFSGSLPSNLYPKQNKNTQILMWHGTSDKVVPFELGEKTASAFENAGFSTEFNIGENKGHILPPAEIVKEYFRLVL